MNHNFDIVIIDDNEDDYELCRRRLDEIKDKDLGVVTFSIRWVQSGEQGIREIKSKQPDCVLLDYSLPGNDGLAVLNEIRKLNANLPVIVLTGQGNEKLAVNLLKAGAHEYIVKSDFDADSFSKVVLNRVKEFIRTESECIDEENEQLRVLVIDDNDDDRELVRRYLAKADPGFYAVTEVSSGRNIMDVVENLRPHCVLLDYSLPGEDGLQILKKLSNHFRFIPVVLFSGQGNETIAAEAIKNGAFHYLVKSELNAGLLDSTIKSGVGRRRLERVVDEKNHEIKQHQRTSLESKNRYDRVVAATGIVVWEYDRDATQYFLDEQIKLLLGDSLESEKITYSDWCSYIHADDQAEYKRDRQAFLEGTNTEYELVYRIKHKDKGYRWIREAGNRPEIDSPQLVGLFEDITKRIQQEHALREFYELTVNTSLSFEEKVQKVLALGCTYFEMETGLVSQITDSRYKVIFSQPQTSLSPGQRFDYSETYCSNVFGYSRVQSWHHAGKSEIKSHPCYLNLRLECYIGTTVYVNNRPYGTVAFVKKTARSFPFSDTEKALMRFMSQWIGAELSRIENHRKTQESEEFLQLVLDSIPDYIFVKDEDFRIVRCNPAFLGLYPEKERGSVVGYTTLEAYDDDEAAEFLRHDKLAFERGSSETEEMIQFPNGETRTLHTKKIRFHGERGAPYILGIARDITDRKQSAARLAESEERFELAVKGSSVGLWDWNVVTGDLFWSDRFKEIIGITDADFRPHYEEFSERLHPDDKELVEDALFSHVESGSPYDVEYRLKKTNGDYVWIHARGQAIWNNKGQATRMAGSVDDISPRKKAEGELLRSNQELERFAYVASHDLQEPLRMVVNFSQLLEKHYSDKLDDRANEYIQFAAGGARRMQELVRDLLSYARIGSRAERLELVNLNELIVSVEDTLQSAIQETKAEISWAELPVVYADPSRIRSVFQNLIGNAIKYRKESIPPKIEITVVSAEEEWEFVISDNGIGMKQEYCQKIFEPFRRLHQKDEFSGTGMGLSICRKTIEELGGSIWAISEQEKGSRFYFRLPKVDDKQLGTVQHEKA